MGANESTLMLMKSKLNESLNRYVTLDTGLLKKIAIKPSMVIGCTINYNIKWYQWRSKGKAAAVAADTLATPQHGILHCIKGTNQGIDMKI